MGWGGSGADTGIRCRWGREQPWCRGWVQGLLGAGGWGRTKGAPWLLPVRPGPCPLPRAPAGLGAAGVLLAPAMPSPTAAVCMRGRWHTLHSELYIKKKMYSRSYLQQPHGQAGELKWRWPAQSAAPLAGPRPGQEPCQGGAWAGAASRAGGVAAVAEAEHPPPRWSRGGPRWLQLKAGAASLRAGVAERTPPRSSSGAAFSWDTRLGGARAQEQGTTRARGRAQSVPGGTTWRH